MKRKLLSHTGLARRFSSDQQGATALTFALGLTVMLMGVGMGVDFAAASKATLKAQNIADATAIAAAAYVRENPDSTPQSDAEGFRDGVWYDARDLGYTFDGHIRDGEQGIRVMVEYRQNDAVVYVKGATKTSLMNLFGYDSLEFNSTAEVEYARETGGDPASVFLILDNSGSMNWDDGSGNKRIDGLQESVRRFMQQLSTVQDDLQPGDQRPLRTSMIPFTGACIAYGDICNTVQNDGIIAGDYVAPDFGIVVEDDINAMIPRWSTDPVASLRRARTLMQDEHDIHWNELVRSGNDAALDEDEFESLRFVVLMSDGANSTSRTRCQENTLPSNRNWVGRTADGRYFDVQDRYRLIRWNYAPPGAEDRNFNNMTEAQTRRRLRRRYNNGSRGSWFFVDQDYDNDGTADPEWDYWNPIGVRMFDDHRNGHTFTVENGDNSSKRYYTCDWVDNSGINTDMRNTCQAMRDEGVTIYTIGYGLVAQDYATNWVGDPVEPIRQDAADTARANLRQCATSEDHFLLAENAADLERVFEEIGQNIVDEAMRLSK